MLTGYRGRVSSLLRSRFLKALIGRFQELYGRPLDGRKKLQKLTFLVEHWSPSEEKVVRSTRLTGYTFRIWMYGPFSEEIQDDLGQLVEKGEVLEQVYWYEVTPSFNEVYLGTYVDDGEPKKLYLYSLTRPRPRLKAQVEGRLDDVLKRFGHLTPMDLEQLVNRMLRLTPLKKTEHWNETVDEYLERGALL
ncbi:MAG: hypothetical protein DRJ69_03375 [Thermoprotei archaeon]|nr:MAG: hypothetical protein DRJ69_03375 [Thermoprotei archaeon]